MVFTKLIFSRSVFSKITAEYEKNFKELFLHKGMKVSGRIFLGRVVYAKNDDRIYFHPAKADSTIDKTKTFSIFFSTFNYALSGGGSILFSTLNYNDGTTDKRIFRLEFNYQNLLLNLFPLFFIDEKTNDLYIEIVYLPGMLKYYVGKFDVVNFSLFENNIFTDLPILNTSLNALNTDEKNPIIILGEEDIKWYGANSDPETLIKEINLRIGAIDYNVLDQSVNAFIFDDFGVGEFRINNRTIPDQSISIFAKGNNITPVFKASIDVGTSTTISVAGTNTTIEGLFYNCKISNGTITNPIKGIKIDTPNPTQFAKLTARINFINKLLGYTGTI